MLRYRRIAQRRLVLLATPGFTIESAKYNLNVNDVANDLNAARPIVAGGTSASNINEALVKPEGRAQLSDNS